MGQNRRAGASAPHEVVELRVHGVHGTSPAAMLGVGDGDVGRVAGDDLTGIYRLRDGDPPLRSLTPGPEESRAPVSVEAYSWGALTSGVQGFLGWVRRSLWLLLLPFALVNLAYWARVDLARVHLRARLGARAVRTAGLLLTVFFVLTPCLLFVDLLAWQCFRYGVPSCEPLPGWADALADLTPGQRVSVASLGPMLVLAVLWSLSRTTVTRYEDVGEAPPGIRPGAAPSTDGRPVLRHPALWRGRDRTRSLARRHLAAGVATVALFLGQHLAVAGRLSGVEEVLVLAVVGVGWATLLGCLLLVLVPHDDDVDPRAVDSPWTRAGDRVRARAGTLDRVVGGLALATYAALVLLLCTGAGADLDQDSAWVGRTFWFLAVFVAVTLLHLVVFTGGRMPLPVAFGVVGLVLAAFVALVWAQNAGRYGPDDGTTVAVVGAVAVATAVGLGVWHYRHGRQLLEVKARAWRGAGPSVLLAAGAWVALLFTSATVVATADFLNGADHGVGDLVSTTKVETEEFQAEQRSPLQRTPARTTYAAAGDVVVHHARLVRSADGDVEVTAGQVSADGFWRAARPGVTGKRFGRTEIGSEATLRLPGTILLADYSCVDARPTTGRCTAEDLAFRGSSRIEVPEGRTLTLARGVVLDPLESPQAPLAIPPVLLWMPLAQLLWVLLVPLVLLGAVLRFRSGSAGLDLVPGRPDDDIPHRDRPACLQARRRAAFAHRAERLLDLVGLVTSLVALPVVVLALTGAAPWQLEGAGWTRGVADLAMYLVVGLSALLIGLGSRMRRSESARKAVGVLWDLTTFWPRAAHPLAPPCYAERVVPELLQRSRWVLNRHERNLLVLSGHSQGSLIVVAVASRLSDEHLGRVRLVTYGSQVRALYGRVFPGVLGADDVGYVPTPDVTRLGDLFPDVPADPAPAAVDPVAGSLRGRLLAAGGRWVNLFRRTDPLGFRVFGDVDGEVAAPWDRSVDLPVAEVPTGQAGDPGPRVQGHGGYQHTLTYREVVATWTGEPVQRAATGTHDVPCHPVG